MRVLFLLMYSNHLQGFHFCLCTWGGGRFISAIVLLITCESIIFAYICESLAYQFKNLFIFFGHKFKN